eukprot:6562267-Pyramimonas_sp.AAC.2
MQTTLITMSRAHKSNTDICNRSYVASSLYIVHQQRTRASNAGRTRTSATRVKCGSHDALVAEIPEGFRCPEGVTTTREVLEATPSPDQQCVERIPAVFAEILHKMLTAGQYRRSPSAFVLFDRTNAKYLVSVRGLPSTVVRSLRNARLDRQTGAFATSM